MECAEVSSAPQEVPKSPVHHPRDQAIATVIDFEAARARATSQRQFARETGVPRTTLQRCLAAKERLHDDPGVVAFFESPSGLRFLHRLEVALLLVMTLVGACGLRHVSLVFRLVGLARWIACSEGTTRKVSAALEQAVVAFGATEQTRLAKTMPSRTITACEDETFHPAPCLVAIEPVSNFILLEQYASGRDASNWNTAMTEALIGLPVTIEQVTSDEASGLRKHVREGLGAQPSPDLFHVQYELSRGTASRLAAQLRQTEVAHQQAQQTLAKRAVDMRASKVAKARRAVEKTAAALHEAQTRRQGVQEAIRALGHAYHPFDLQIGTKRDATIVEAALREQFTVIEAHVKQAALSEKGFARIAKAARVVPAMVATIAWVHRTITARVHALRLTAAVTDLLHTHIIPGLYLQRVAARAATAEARAALHAQATNLLAVLHDPTGVWTALAPGIRAQTLRTAQECADLFQRASSCVEGRNGQLSLHHHHLHRLRSRKLKALTVIHNFFLRRSDGTTAAERFFGTRPNDLFEHLCAVLPLPARPRIRSRGQPAQVLRETG